LRADWKIINRLRMGPKSVAQIAQALKVSRPAVSQGLKILLQARLVNFEIVGRKVFYSLDLDGLSPLRQELEGLEDVAKKYGNKEPGT
jgi:DNA-binding transcriptional ArsR family regulator